MPHAARPRLNPPPAVADGGTNLEAAEREAVGTAFPDVKSDSRSAANALAGNGH